MLELLLASLVTVLPDYLFRRYVQGKRWGVDMNFYSVWYELRWGITACVMLTIALITVIFYYHPSTTNVSSFFRTLTVLSETGGRVSEVYIENHQVVKAGDPLFKIDDAGQQADVETARLRVAEVDAAMVVAQSELAAAQGMFDIAASSLEQAQEELDVQAELMKRNPDIVSKREIERREQVVAGRRGGVAAAMANKKAVEEKIASLLPAQKASAVSALHEADIELSKATVYAGVDGTITQFALQPGDYVNPILRPAGILVPTELGRNQFQAGFGQIAAQVIKPGMIAEITCISKPYAIIPMIVSEVQDVIVTGQFRPTDQLLDLQDRARPGSLNVVLEPLYEGGVDDVPPGSKCIANVYTNYHEQLAAGGLGTKEWLFMHMVDAVAVVHALILRVQALLLPVKLLVFAGH